jgi:hypothetical protein
MQACEHDSASLSSEFQATIISQRPQFNAISYDRNFESRMRSELQPFTDFFGQYDSTEAIHCNGLGHGKYIAISFTIWQANDWPEKSAISGCPGINRTGNV